jgi:hypothetical protein
MASALSVSLQWCDGGAPVETQGKTPGQGVRGFASEAESSFQNKDEILTSFVELLITLTNSL